MLYVHHLDKEKIEGKVIKKLKVGVKIKDNNNNTIIGEIREIREMMEIVQKVEMMEVVQKVKIAIAVLKPNAS